MTARRAAAAGWHFLYQVVKRARCRSERQRVRRRVCAIWQGQVVHAQPTRLLRLPELTPG